MDWASEDSGGRSRVNSEMHPLNEPVLDFYRTEDPTNKALIDATSMYHSSELPQYDRERNAVGQGGGILPQAVLHAAKPSLIVSQTRSERSVNVPSTIWEPA
ncbi:hypothetical protein D3C86_1941170 [compost metagenome]